MVVKIFKSRARFTAVRYNTNKMDKGLGELMKVSGFGSLQNFGHLRPEDYRLYLETLSEFNRNVRKPQFHAMISCEGRSKNKHELTRAAEEWLQAMGYGDQPYLIVFHNDTPHNHVHIVTTRVNREGKKINSAFEKRRAVAQMNRIMGLDEKHRAQLDAGKALSYICSTQAQLKLVLERMGYRIHDKDGNWALYRSGEKQYTIGAAQVQKSLNNYQPDAKRSAQLKAIFHKYKLQYDATPVRETQKLAGGRTKETADFRSELGDYLLEKFGIELVFHASGDKPPYGYTIIDHTAGQVYKGSEIMRMQAFTEAPKLSAETSEPDIPQEKHDYQPTLRFYFTDDTDDQQIHGPRRRRQKKARTNTR